jgi:hypothetical protein
MGNQQEGFFTVRGGISSVKTPPLMKLWCVKDLDSLKGIKKALFSAVKATKTTLPKARLHRFISKNTSISNIKRDSLERYCKILFNFDRDLVLCGGITKLHIRCIDN